MLRKNDRKLSCQPRGPNSEPATKPTYTDFSPAYTSIVTPLYHPQRGHTVSTARRSIRRPIRAPSTLKQMLILRCQCCSRGSKTSSYRAQTAIRLSSPKPFHLPIVPCAFATRPPRMQLEAQRKSGARATRCREASCMLEGGWPCCQGPGQSRGGVEGNRSFHARLPTARS